ncbi:MAG: histidine kinase dimerization/phospho-acceptor domain-containing protein [Erythrobacter sp.]|jgi:signal transduction histidine kinase|uniref:histidine kinase dimerization/phospho-acceptor domain-containing protein n=1 Tax=Erythrobacter sp. TaxID=1042 RepID=UPI002B4A88B6|nr:histidine kinase dimerization/phospho-acceptor domain-containing protein [Erythrobacter sp.]WRH70577.1 MAG: histidine kinase dimerization/phospho-acceptor domain-containing protein [Erythrobacter sp.]
MEAADSGGVRAQWAVAVAGGVSPSVFFDDRLATVLRQRATGEAGLRTQYRQLLDLLGKDRLHPANAQHQSLVAAAWLRMDTLADAIPAPQRAGIIREAGWRFRSADLAAHLADQEPEVAMAALSRAELSVEDWTALIPRLPVRARGFLRLRRDLPVDVEALLARLGIHDRGLPRPDNSVAPEPASSAHAPATRPLEPAEPAEPSAPPVAPALIPLHRRERATVADPDETGRSEISALVERIAQFRRERSETGSDADIAPRLPLGEFPELPERPIAAFGFAADAAGRIEWASSEVAPMVIGTRLVAPRALASTIVEESAIDRAFARRQPILGHRFTLGGASAISGEWTLDAQPSFSFEGHFTGYVGRLRRPLADLEQPAPAEAREADRIRQLLHELRTPVTAVQGYAEVIQQQLFGPAPHEYRALAAAIAADAARILAGFDELDRLARLETGALGIDPGEADIARLTRRIVDQLTPVLAAREAGIALVLTPDASLLAGCDSDDAEALLWRLLASLAAACGAGEQLAARLSPVILQGQPQARLECSLPADLAREDNLFAATARPPESAINAGLFGAGFAFRLARAEARAAGGALTCEDGKLVLTLPLLTLSDDLPSHQAGVAR